VTLLVAMSAAAPAAALYSQTNLVSDLQGVAAHQDTNLVNPWGMSYAPGSPFWVSDNGTGVSTLYTADGTVVPLVVTVPSDAGGQPPSAPTGQVYNPTSGFMVDGVNPALFLFSSEDGTISGWRGGTSAVLLVDQSPAGAVYKGLALETNTKGASLLLAPNFASGSIDVFDGGFTQVFGSGFIDPNLPSGYAPFNVANLGGSIFVSFAKKGAGIDDDPGVGNGFVDVFDTQGALQRRLVSGGVLNSPWGMAIAPADFGEFSNALLVGNFGDGLIHAYDKTTGQLLGTLESSPGHSIQIDGLWALLFGGGSANDGSTNTLFFTAGIAGPGMTEDHGLFGSLTAVPEPDTGAELALGTFALALNARRRRTRR
jgi:uncharacterized protein (TIGR03118 family)